MTHHFDKVTEELIFVNHLVNRILRGIEIYYSLAYQYSFDGHLMNKLLRLNIPYENIIYIEN